MKKAVLISIRPEWVEKILNGEKTIEIRKTAPKCELPIDVYIYCTKSKILVDWQEYLEGERYEALSECPPLNKPQLQGKVVAKFTLKKIDWFCSEEFSGSYEKGVVSFSNTFKLFSSEDACMSQQEIYEYTKFEPARGWHISDLEIFDQPKELSDFRSLPKTYHHDYESMVDYYRNKEERRLKRAPQSWQYVEVER